MSEETARDLENAATLLREMGWCQGSMTNGAGCHCAMGALAVICEGEWTPRWDEAREALYRQFGGRHAIPSLVEWNDTPGRTAEEVISALEAAASLTRSRASS